MIRSDLLFRWFWNGLDWLFPPYCAGCGRLGYRWCPECQKQVEVLAGPVCQVCGTPLQAEACCRSCERSRPPYEAMRSWAAFSGPLRRALHTLKYRRNFALGEALAHQMFPFVKSLGWTINCLVPVPLGKARLKERGYNQVALVAAPLAGFMRWRYLPQALRRVRETRSQVGLSAAERRLNVQNAFQAQAALVAGQTVLVMDDVATTGSTLVACATALLEAGARQVYALTVARALSKYGLDSIPKSLQEAPYGSHS